MEIGKPCTAQTTVKYYKTNPDMEPPEKENGDFLKTNGEEIYRMTLKSDEPL